MANILLQDYEQITQVDRKYRENGGYREKMP